MIRKEKTMEKVTYKITKEVAVLSEKPNGFTKEVNFVSWNGDDAKLDLRSWFPEHDKCGKGITLNEEESKILYEALGKVIDHGNE